jgi:hypothetical protein
MAKTLEDHIKTILGPGSFHPNAPQLTDADLLRFASVGGDLYGAIVKEFQRETEEANGDFTVVAKNQLQVLHETNLITQSEVSQLHLIVDILNSNAKSSEASHQIEQMHKSLTQGQENPSPVALLLVGIAVDATRSVVHAGGGFGTIRTEGDFAGGVVDGAIAGAILGAALGAPEGGIGAIPGAILGAIVGAGVKAIALKS